MCLERGDAAPDVELKNHRGESLRLADYWAEKPLLLVFLRHLGCPLCFDHVARIRERCETFRERGIGVVTVTMGDTGQAAKFKESQRLPCEVLADPHPKAYSA